jgi:hypothetical protein
LVLDGQKKQKEIEALKAEVETLKVAVSGFQRLGMKSKRRSVLIRGLIFKSADKFKNRSQTKQALGEFFGRIGATLHLVDYHCLGGRRDGKDGSKASIRVVFSDVDQKLGLFDKLKIKGREFANISILTDYPNFQLQEFKALSEQADRLRTEKPGTRTRIVPRVIGLSLQSRANTSDRPTRLRHASCFENILCKKF